MADLFQNYAQQAAANSGATPRAPTARPAGADATNPTQAPTQPTTQAPAQPSVEDQIKQLDQQYAEALAKLNANGMVPQKVKDQLTESYQRQRNALREQGMNQGLSDFNAMTKDVSQKLSEVAQHPDQAMADRYYSEMDAPIQSNFYNSANNVSTYLARQGLGSSGMNLAAHAGLEQNRSALEGQAKLKATDMSIEKQRQQLLDEFSTQAMGMQPNLQKYGIDTSAAIAQMQIQAQLQMMREQLDAQGMAGLGNLAGQIGGGLAGNPSLFTSGAAA